MHLKKYHWNFELFPFLLPVKPPLKELCVRVLRLDSMLKFTLRRKHNTQTAVIIGKTSKENNGTYCFFTENKKGNACKRSYSGGRLLKSFLRHVRILQKPMQEKERKIDPSSCKSYIYGQKKKQQLNERHSLFPRSNLVVYSNFAGNLQGNHGMAFGRGFKTNQSFIYF